MQYRQINVWQPKISVLRHYYCNPELAILRLFERYVICGGIFATVGPESRHRMA